MIDKIDMKEYLIWNDDDDGISGGKIDALIVHAINEQHSTDNNFSETFRATYCTFITPLDLIKKLIHRHSILRDRNDTLGKMSAHESFEFLRRILNDLMVPDINRSIIKVLCNFVYNLILEGQLDLAIPIREYYIRQSEILKNEGEQESNIFSLLSHPPTLLDFSGCDIAKQLTLLDAEMFNKITIFEILYRSKEQADKSPNLNRFTDHFNNISFWVSTQIIKAEDNRIRQRYVSKFIDILRQLAKLNNFNTYMAVMSALDSAPIRRLDWPQPIQDQINECALLVDTQMNFQTYRQALARAKPPCIPIMAIVLHGLTAVHNAPGNATYLEEDILNFSKCSQLHNIISEMMRFKNYSYSFPKNQQIITFFDNFETSMEQEALWGGSLAIKPRKTTQS